MASSTTSLASPWRDARGVAEHFGLSSERAVYKLAEAGSIPYVRVGKRRLRFNLDDLETLFERTARQEVGE